MPASPLPRFDRLACLLACLPPIAWVVLSSVGESATRIFHWPWAFYAQAALLAPLVLLAWQWLRHTRPPAVLLGAIAFAAVGTLLSVIFSRNPHFSLEVALFPLGGLAALLWFHGALGRLLADEARFLRIARLVGLAALVPLLASAFYFLSDAHVHGLSALQNRNRHPFGHWNYTAGYILLAAPWFLALAWRSRLLPRLLWLASFALSLALLWTCHSRGAVLGTIVGVALALLWRVHVRPPTRRQALVLVLGALLACAALFLTNERLRGYLVTPEVALNPSEGDVQRIAMLKGGWLLFQNRPVLGHGPGLVPMAYPEVRGQLVGGVETSFQLHNSPLHLAATHGVLGLAALALLLVLIALGTRRWWRAPAGPARNFAFTSLCALAAYGAMSITDYQLDVIGIVVLLAWHSALLLVIPSTRKNPGKPAFDAHAAPAEKPEDDLRLDGVFSTGVLALAIAAVIVLLPHWRARSLYWESSLQTEPDLRLRLLDAAAEAAPWSAQYRNQHGFALARLVEQHPEATPLREAARESLLRSLLIDRAQEPVHATLGWLWLPDNPSRAKHHFEEAVRLLPDRPVNRLGLALALLALNDTEAARQALAVECLVYPAFIVSPLWHAPGLMAQRAAVLARLDALYAAALADPALPRWRVAPVNYSRAFTAWIVTGAPPSADALVDATPQQRAFFDACSSAPAGDWPAPWDSWRHLREHPERAADILGNLRATPSLDPVVVQAAEARLRLDSPAPDVLVRTLAPAGLPLVTTVFERGHYSLYHRSSDDAWYPDLGPRTMDALGTLYLTPLLPKPGIIPAPVLLKLDRDFR